MILFRKTLYTLLAICCTALAMPLAAPAQGVLPSASPKMWVLQEDGSESDLTSYDGSAPMQARFVAEVSDLGSFLARYEWRFYRQGEEKPFLTRYENAALRANVHKPVASNLVVFHTLLGLSGVATPYANSAYSLCSPAYSSPKRYYLNDHNDPLPMNEIGLKEQDVTMLPAFSLILVVFSFFFPV